MKLFRRPNRKLAKRLETERFVLEPVGLLGALRVTRSWRNDPEILTVFFSSDKPRPFYKWLRSHLMPNNQTRFGFAIVPKGSAAPIGMDVVCLSGYRSAYATIALHDREWRGQSVVTEIRARLIDHFFRNGEIDRFCGTVEGRNASSIFNYQRLGFDHVGTWHRHTENKTTGEIMDFVYFEMFRDKWIGGPWSELGDER